MSNWKSKYLKYKLKYKKLNGGMLNSKSSSASKLNYPRPLNLSAEGDKSEKNWNYKPVKKRGKKTTKTSLSSEQISPQKIKEYYEELEDLLFWTNISVEQSITYDTEKKFKSIYEELEKLKKDVFGEVDLKLDFSKANVDKLNFLKEKYEFIDKITEEEEVDLVKTQEIYNSFNNNLRLYFENIADGDLLFYGSHSELNNSVFKTKLNIIFLESVGTLCPSGKGIKISSKLKERIINLDNNNKYFKLDNGWEGEVEEGSDFVSRHNKPYNVGGIKLRIHLPNTLINNQVVCFNSAANIENQHFSPSFMTRYENLEHYTDLYRKVESGPKLDTYIDYYREYREEYHMFNLFDEKHYIRPAIGPDGDEIYNEYSESDSLRFNHNYDLTLADICFSLERMNFKGTIIFHGCRGVETTRQLQLSRMTSNINDSNINSIISDTYISGIEELSTQINYRDLFQLHFFNNNENLESKILINREFVNTTSMSYDLIYKQFLIINKILKETGSKKVTLNEFLNFLNKSCDYISTLFHKQGSLKDRIEALERENNQNRDGYITRLSSRIENLEQALLGYTSSGNIKDRVSALENVPEQQNYENCYDKKKYRRSLWEDEEEDIINKKIMIELIIKQIYVTSKNPIIRKISSIELHDYIIEQIEKFQKDVSIPETTDMFELKEFPKPKYAISRAILTKLERHAFGDDKDRGEGRGSPAWGWGTMVPLKKRIDTLVDELEPALPSGGYATSAYEDYEEKMRALELYYKEYMDIL